MNIYKNFLPKKDFLNFKKEIMGEYFPWYFNNQKVYKTKHLNDFQFCNTFKDGNTANNLINIFIKKLKIKKLLRAKLNLTTKTDKIYKFNYHQDWDSDCNVAIYYINSNNGYTHFKNKTKIFSEENKIVIFDNKLKHYGTTSTNTKTRIVLNMCFLN